MSTTERRQLTFEVGGHLFAVDARQAVEVLEVVESTPVPGAVAGVLGLLNLRGRLIVAGDLAVLLGFGPAVHAEAAFVVLESEGRSVALRVDRVVGFAATPEGGLDVDSDLLEALGASGVLAGVGKLGPRPYFQLDPSALFHLVLAADAGSVQHGITGGR